MKSIKKITGVTMKKQVNKKGFTLIEVVLVLAIGGLIFLLAFLAFQQVSRNRRDTQRRSDVARAAAVYSDLKADSTGGAVTEAAWSAAITAIPNFKDPGGNNPNYAVSVVATKPSPLTVGTIWIDIPTSGTPQACVGIESNTAGACRNVE